MAAADAPNVAAIEKQCFSTPWSQQVLEMELQNKCALFFVAEENGSILGHIGMHAVMDEGFIANVAVAKDHRRHGVATALLDRLIQCAQKKRLGFLTLEVRESNLPAIAFYQKSGFAQVGRRKNFYSSPEEDALLMTRFFGREKEAAQ